MRTLHVTRAAAGLALASFLVAPGTREALRPARPDAWVLTWSDEFDGDGVPAEKNWTYDTGGGGWGNHELESYTARPANSAVRGGHLEITAIRENFTGSDGIPREYTSARLKTLGRFSQAYGRFEARIRIPEGPGMWPAFWLMGDNIGKVGWPKCGEIDVMENIGTEPGIVSGSLHGPSTIGETTSESSEFRLADPGRFADAFHVYAIEWEPERVRFYVDDTSFATYERADWKKTGPWPFDHPFFILLNLAVGGEWPGPPGPSTKFPQTMRVDYVRVYQRR